MAMTFGTKFDPNESSEGGGEYIHNFKEGTTVVRFLEELEDWTAYWETYNPEGRNGKGAFFPSPGKDSPYNGERSSRRYLVNCLVNGNVTIYKVPASLIDRIARRADKFGTLTDRDYEITRSGKGLQTEYDIEVGDKAKLDLSAYQNQILSHEKMLQDAFMEAWGKLPGDEDEDQSPREEKPAKREVKSETKVAEGEDPPSEPQREQEGDAEETILSEAQIRDMSRSELIQLSKDAGLDADVDDMSRSELADYIIETLSE